MASISITGQTRQRQIVIVAVGGLILAGLLLFQLPRTLKMLRGAESSAPAATEQAPPPPVTPGTPVSPAVPVTPPPPATRAVSLTRFRSKDPFVQQVNPSATPTGTQSSGSTAPASPPPASTPDSFRAIGSTNRSSAAKAGATIAVNGAKESVGVSKSFPKANPVFRLVSVGDGTAKVGIASGTLKGGSQAVTLTKGEPLTLLNTVDGKRYKLELVSVSS
jgi:hypothetical protein